MKINWRYVFEWSAILAMLIVEMIAALFIADWLRSVGG